MFKSFRPILRCASELRRIANALEYFAIDHARENNRMFITKPSKAGKDASELLHTDEVALATQEKERWEQFLQGGAKLLDREEAEDE